MTRTCVVCNKVYTKGSDKSFHSFPKNEIRKKLWLNASKIKFTLPSYKICGDHFLPEHYLPSGYLKNDAVPILASTSTDIDHSYHLLESSSPCQSPMTHSCVKSVASMSTDIEHLYNLLDSSSPCQNPIKHKKILLNPNSIGLLSPSHFKTPRKAKMHLDMVKHKYKEKQIENQNLKKKIKRLKNKLASYDNLVLKLQQKQF